MPRPVKLEFQVADVKEFQVAVLQKKKKEFQVADVKAAERR